MPFGQQILLYLYKMGLTRGKFKKINLKKTDSLLVYFFEEKLLLVT